MKETYLLTNLITGDEYVGVTGDKKGLKKRLANHKERARCGRYNHLPLYANINEYGWDNFHAKVIQEGDHEEYYCWLMRPTLNQCWVGKKPISQKQVEACRKANSKAIRCVETGAVYKSAREAGRQLGKDKLFSSISNVLKGKAETAAGYHWEYVL
jgi:hypothetical protein